ncbi:MAG TPA: hypothetical protein VGR19_00850 [Allosphingosinicella sp.]|nr:hypothetical protein [Allosphingosinicella sp.]
MTQDPTALIALASSGLIALSVASAAALKGWTAWLELKRLELTSGLRPSKPSRPLSRIEVSDLKERVRRLEAIANGVD